MDCKKQLRQCVKTRYGNWVLVHLPSGQWAGIWAQALSVDEMCEAILSGTWFHAENPSFGNRTGALQRIVKGIEDEIANARFAGNGDAFQSFLQRARAALARHSAESQ